MRQDLRRCLLSALVVLLVAPALAVLGAAPAAAAAFSPGNVVVARVGDGSGALSSAATPVFLDEYTPSGTLVQSITLPTATSGANRRLTMSGSATSEGALALSQDGNYLTLAGYDANPGTSGIAGTTTTSVSRVVGRVDGAGNVDTSTAITDAFSGNNVRGAVTDNGSRFWAVGANGGVRLVALGGTGTTTQINSAAPTNLRAVSIAAGQLYISTGSGTTGVYTVGAGLPTTGGQTPALVTAAPSPFAFVPLDRDPSVPGVDTLYVADDSGSPNGGILKFSFDGTSWTARGSFRPDGSGARGLTGSATPSGVTLFTTTTTTGNKLVKVEDTAAFNAMIAATGTTLATAAANTVLRGVAFSPAQAAAAPSITGQPQDTTITTGSTATLTVTATGTEPLTYQWYTGTAGDTANPITGATASSFTTPPLTSTSTYWVRVSGPGGQVDSRTATVTVTAAPNTPPTITPNPVQDLALTIADPDNPPALRTVDVADAETPASGLIVTVTSSNPAVATGGATGTGATRTLNVDPVGVGRATLTVTVSDGELSSATTFPVAVSGALPAGTKNHYGASDASTAIDLGDGAMVVADDETNLLRVYDRTHSRYPASALDLRAAGLALRDGNVTREIDIEASARSGNTIYWLGSHGQNSSGNLRLNRQELFTTVTGTGLGATLALGGSYQTLRDDLIAWDNANGGVLGLAAAATRPPEGSGTGPTGFNIEAAEFAPDGSTLLVGFRGPLTTDGKAIVVPVTNISALVSANPTTGVTAAFGAALRWDLGGRGVREIRRNAANQYLIIAGPSDAGTGAPGEFRFYSWDGNPASQPLPRAGSLDSPAAVGKPEVIVEVPNPLTNASAVQVLTDSGDTVWYGDGVIAKDLPLVLRKATSSTVTVGAPPACSSGAVPIGSVQGTGDISPVAGQTVSVRGTVVGDYEGPSPALRGFYLQDSGDANPATSDGIFVFNSNANLVASGDVVQVTGTALEFQGQTQITPATGGVESCGQQAGVTPIDVTLPRASATDLEPFEGMLVRFRQSLTVTEHFQLGRFGQVVVSSGGRLRQPTAVISATDQPAVQALQQANNLNRIIIDDDRNSQNPDPIIFGRGGAPLSATNTLRGGDTVTDPVGVLTFTWAGNAASGNAYRLRPIGALGGAALFDPTNERPAAPPSTGTGGVKVASANLLNFFNTFTGCRLGTLGAITDCRGAENAAEYQRQLDKEVASLRFLNADVVGVMELENDGYGPSSAIQALVDALNAADGAGSWAFIDPDAATGVTDVAGTDAIKVGLLYKPAAVQPVAGGTFVDQNAVFERRPVAQTFRTPTGAVLTTVVNHFKSKGSCPASGPDTDQGDGQSCWNARRTAQATELAGWVSATVLPAAGDPDVLIIGDLNSYAGENPIAVLEAAGYTNLVKSFEGPDAYSFVFDGQWGALDYTLASASLTPQVTGAGDAHHNADEPSVLDYNTNFKSAGQITSLYAPDRFRTSDHDPILVGLDLVNRPPLAVDDAYTTAEDNLLIVPVPGVLGNDTDPEGGPLTATLVTGPTNGTLTLNPNGSFTYTPNPHYNGPDTFTYTASDGTATSSTATVALTVTPVNDAPVAVNDAYTTAEDTPLTVGPPGVLGNDTDIDNNPLTATLVTGPTNGTLTLNPNGSFTYTPNANFTGPDSFTYTASDGTATSSTATVALTVTPVNDAPVAVNDAYTTAEDTLLTVGAPGVLGNDTDIDNNPLTAALVTGPTNGTLTLNPNGSFTYTPNPHYNGPDSFTYRASDGTATSSTATVALTVTPVNDAPVVTVAAGGSCSSDDRSGTMNLALTDLDHPATALTLGVTSSNTTLVPTSNVTLAGAGATRTLRASTAFLRTGTAVLTLTVSDGQNSTTTPITVHAGSFGNDTLTGTPGADLMLGQLGFDTLSGLAGKDLLCGGTTGGDTLHGGDHDDTLIGGLVFDTLNGGPGDDTLTGGFGPDRFSGGPGTDTATDFNALLGDTQDGTIP